MTKVKNKRIFIAWTKFQRRQVSMQLYFGFECIFMPVSMGGILNKLFQYILLFCKSLRAMHDHKADVVWVQLPQVPLLWAAFVYRWCRQGKVSIVADCHNSMFRRPWINFPLGFSILKYCDCVLIHNSTVTLDVESARIPPEKLFVLEDVPPLVNQSFKSTKRSDLRPVIVFPASYTKDEPIAEVFAAARIAPDLKFIITGNSKMMGKDFQFTDMPSNLILSGFLSLDDFNQLIRDADVILGLTHFEGIQLSVCNEALGFGKAMVLSDRRILRELFSGPSIFIDSSKPSEIVFGIKTALLQQQQLEAAARDLFTQRLHRWKSEQAAAVSNRLGQKQANFDTKISSPMRVVLTWDYEIFFGKKTGSVYDCLIAPTNVLLKIARDHTVKMVFFVDAGFLFKLKVLSKDNPIFTKDLIEIKQQLHQIVREGHEIQLHVHPHWEDSVWNGTEWQIDTSRYKINDFDENQVFEIITKYVSVLREFSGYRKIIAFRAGGWSCQPFNKIAAVLQKNGIFIDSSIFPDGVSDSLSQKYDFRKAPEFSLWRFNDDPLEVNESGHFIEIPISSICIPPSFYWKYAFLKTFGGENYSSYSKGSPIVNTRELLFKVIHNSISPVSMDGNKASLLQTAFNRYQHSKHNIFVPIGHPKAITPFSIKCLDRFISEVSSDTKFIGFSDVL